MKQKGESTVLWWVGWILLTILSFFVSAWFWTGFLAKHYGAMDRPGAPVIWVAAVFGSWMVLLVPLIVIMYQKVDKAYEDARIARETAAFEKARAGFRVKSVFVEAAERRLRPELVKKLKSIPEAVRRGHLVHARLRDGRTVNHVFVLNRKEVLGVYGEETLSFRVSDIVDLEAADLDKLPAFKTDGWLRIDGVGAGDGLTGSSGRV